jgi:membrane associated rhomboid family serine protease
MAYRSFRFSFYLTPWVKRLLIANGAVYLLTLLVPGAWRWLAFEPAAILRQPWGAVTYMFTHGGFFHVFFNMLMLFFFGPPLEQAWGGREFIKYYLIAGLGGAVFSFIFAFHTPVIGASAAVLGVMLAFAMNWPDMPIYIWGILPIKAKWLITFLAVMNLLAAVQGSADGVAHFAHLGGLAAGFLYLKLDYRVTGRLQDIRKAVRKKRFSVTPGGAERPVRRNRAEDEALLDEVDRVLDKISQSGLASLTEAERQVLDEVSKKYRQN